MLSSSAKNLKNLLRFEVTETLTVVLRRNVDLIVTLRFLQYYLCCFLESKIEQKFFQ